MYLDDSVSYIPTALKVDLNKTIEQLEGKVYPVVTDSTNLVLKITSLRKKRLSDFTIEDLRICIGQDEGLTYLVPLAIEQLKENILAEGDCYEGDLLISVLRLDKNFWLANKDSWKTVKQLYEEKHQQILEGTEGDKKFDKEFREFSLIHKE